MEDLPISDVKKTSPHMINILLVVLCVVLGYYTSASSGTFNSAFCAALFYFMEAAILFVCGFLHVCARGEHWIKVGLFFCLTGMFTLIFFFLFR